MNKIKFFLFEACKTFVANKLKHVNTTISSNQKALESETKSSAGDKHETGRAMLQLEMEKASQQFIVIKKMQEVLQKIDISKKHDIAKLGSLIDTSNGTYFLAISIGVIPFESNVFFVISPSSPIGSLLLGKKVNDIFLFNEKEIRIKEIY